MVLPKLIVVTNCCKPVCWPLVQSEQELLVMNRQIRELGIVASVFVGQIQTQTVHTKIGVFWRLLTISHRWCTL